MLLALLALAAQAAAPDPAPLRTFQDWTVGCDNARRCEAVALMPVDMDWDGWASLILAHDSGPDGAPTFHIEMEGDPTALFADGRALPVRLTGGADGIRVIDDQRALLHALRSAAALEARDAAGTVLARTSLAGASAAMLHIDDVQGRVGTVTAMTRSGPRPASQVPRPPPLPVVRRSPPPSGRPLAIRPERIAALSREADCAGMMEEGRETEHETVQIAPGTTLVLLPCGMGAYNFSSVPFIARRRGGRIEVAPAAFDRNWSQQGPEATRFAMLINADWDPERRLLTEFAKGRGLGDCGTAADYAWDGTRFRLVRYAEMEECRGSLHRITTWRAAVE